jgi:hypothetical protein
MSLPLYFSYIMGATIKLILLFDSSNYGKVGTLAFEFLTDYQKQNFFVEYLKVFSIKILDKKRYRSKRNN